MKYVRFEHEGRLTLGRLDEDGGIEHLAGDWYEGATPTGLRTAASDALLLAPLDRPRVFGIGNNYHQAIRAQNLAVPQRPLVFVKMSNAVAGPQAPVVFPAASDTVFFEGELCVVIGRPGRHIAREDALSHVFGYTCGNDLTERTLQLAEVAAGSMCLSKSVDTFAPIGPCIATDVDPDDVSIVSRINGEVRQEGHTSDMVFDVPMLIAYISRYVTLMRGDVIMTGTPAGFGPIAVGDEMEIELAGIGTLRNTVVAEDASRGRP